jgi:hypothetical protein
MIALQQEESSPTSRPEAFHLMLNCSPMVLKLVAVVPKNKPVQIAMKNSSLGWLVQPIDFADARYARRHFPVYTTFAE